MSRSPYIFLSYPGGSQDDAEHALRLSELLRLYGLDTWIAELDRPFESQHDSVLRSISSCAAFVACIGSRRIGRWGRTEIETADDRAEQEDDFLVATVLLPGANKQEISSLPPQFAMGPIIDLQAGVVVSTVARLVALLWRGFRHERAELLEEIVRALAGEHEAVVLTGPPGAGKTTLAAVVASQVDDLYRDGIVTFRFDPERDAPGMVTLAMRALELPGAHKPGDKIRAYKEGTWGSRYLIVFDDVTIADATDLVPWRPSAALLVSRRKPLVNARHAVFEVPPLDGSVTPKVEEAASTQPGFDSDLPEGFDLLEIDQPVEALCSVIAAKDVKPPLSIGLFGEWGAGKTFFIGKMQARIAALAEASNGNDASAYCSFIRQIVFNAWHYADANLWASLASRVFEGLAGKENESSRLFETLASSRLQLQEAGAEQEVAQRRASRARQEESQAREELKETKLRLNDLASAAVDIFDEVEDPEPLLRDLRQTLHLPPEEDFGIAAAKSLRTTRGAAAELWRQSKGTIVICVLAAAALVGLLVFFPSVIGLALMGLAAMGAGLRLVGGPLRWVLRASADARRRTEALRRQESARLESELEELYLREREARRRQEEAQRQVEEVERQIAEIRDGRRLFQFIAERSQSDAYEPYMGLMALVRRDFERLAGLIEEHTDTGEEAFPPLERIVLFIDDLDRCPADRVVEVLEAVHLLMASKLFVVVVAVDPRWLLSSLEKHYAKELSTADAGRWAPTPQDYLEKIFQIPFTLPPMEDEGFGRLIKSSVQIQEATPGATDSFARSKAVPPAGDTDTSPATFFADQAPPPVPEALDLQPANLLINREEVEFMSRLGPVVRTPRSAKRLVNLYRLSRASMGPAEMAALLGESARPAYPALQLMLAIVIGFPGLCQALLEGVAAEPAAESWWDFVDRWVPPPEQAQSWGLLSVALTPLRDDSLPELSTFATLVPQVARYSYGTLQLLPSRG